MIGQRFALRASVVGLGDDYRAALPDAGNVAVEVFKRERQLIGIQAFGATPELRSLQLLDDELEALDLTVAASVVASLAALLTSLLICGRALG